jgi:hypothetical protein
VSAALFPALSSWMPGSSPGMTAERMAKIRYKDGEIGRVRVTDDFLPSPDALVPRLDSPHPEEGAKPKARSRASSTRYASRRVGRHHDRRKSATADLRWFETPRKARLLTMRGVRGIDCERC